MVSLLRWNAVLGPVVLPAVYIAGFDHIVVYDDASTDNLSVILQPFVKENLVTYVNWASVQNQRTRQFMAIQDFTVRFAPLATFVLQFDDDCFFFACNPDTGKALPDLRKTLRSVASQCPECGQFRIDSHWFGACRNGTNNRPEPVRQRNDLMTQTFTWRVDEAPFDYKTLYRTGKKRRMHRFLSIARVSKLRRSSGITHDWVVRGPMFHVPMDVLRFHHYKMPALDEAMKKSEYGGWTSSTISEKEWWFGTEEMCQTRDLTLVEPGISMRIRSWTTNVSTIAAWVAQRPTLE